MATAARTLKAALQMILVRAVEAPLEPDQYQDAIFSMNNFMLDLDANGVQLGYTTVTDLGDEITIPTGALRGLIANLAIEVAPDYDAPITDGLIRAAREGLITMRTLGRRIASTQYPSTLPIGSGNEQYYMYSHFYDSDLEEQIFAETTGYIALESGTEAASV